VRDTYGPSLDKWGIYSIRSSCDRFGRRARADRLTSTGGAGAIRSAGSGALQRSGVCAGEGCVAARTVWKA
jgi:hypothetical protein